MPKLIIVAVLAYQAASYDSTYNLIDSNLFDNYTLAVQAGTTPAIDSATVMTGCTMLSESYANTLVFDNDIRTYGYLNDASICIKKYRLDFTNYAATAAGKPIVRTASFVATCFTSTCSFYVTVGDNAEPTSNPKCGPTFTGCGGFAGCSRRADCNLTGIYISLISSGAT